MTQNVPATKLRRLLSRHRGEILALARAHGATSIQIFGSVARGDAREESDVDFLVSFAPGTRVLARLDLKDALEALLGVPVDVTTAAALHRVIRDDVIREATPV